MAPSSGSTMASAFHGWDSWCNDSYKPTLVTAQTEDDGHPRGGLEMPSGACPAIHQQGDVLNFSMDKMKQSPGTKESEHGNFDRGAVQIVSLSRVCAACGCLFLYPNDLGQYLPYCREYVHNLCYLHFAVFLEEFASMQQILEAWHHQCVHSMVLREVGTTEHKVLWLVRLWRLRVLETSVRLDLLRQPFWRWNFLLSSSSSSADILPAMVDSSSSSVGRPNNDPQARLIPAPMARKLPYQVRCQCWW